MYTYTIYYCTYIVQLYCKGVKTGSRCLNEIVVRTLAKCLGRINVLWYIRDGNYSRPKPYGSNDRGSLTFWGRHVGARVPQFAKQGQYFHEQGLLLRYLPRSVPYLGRHFDSTCLLLYRKMATEYHDYSFTRWRLYCKSLGCTTAAFTKHSFLPWHSTIEKFAFKAHISNSRVASADHCTTRQVLTLLRQSENISGYGANN